MRKSGVTIWLSRNKPRDVTVNAVNILFELEGEPTSNREVAGHEAAFKKLALVRRAIYTSDVMTLFVFPYSGRGDQRFIDAVLEVARSRFDVSEITDDKDKRRRFRRR